MLRDCVIVRLACSMGTIREGFLEVVEAGKLSWEGERETVSYRAFQLLPRDLAQQQLSGSKITLARLCPS